VTLTDVRIGPRFKAEDDEWEEGRRWNRRLKG
jgi:hypothetical protein